MKQLLPNKCPLCSGALEITEASCLDCGIQLRGHFELAPYRNLDTEQLRFLETFLRCRGIIRDVEAALGISYPTVRARLDALLNALDFTGTPPLTKAPTPMTAEQKSAKRKEILNAIQNGTIDADTGLNALHDLSGDTP
jgi:hypothetical protein